MSQALDFVTKPTDGDTGTVFWDLLEDLFTAFDDHTHDGSNSNTLSTAAFAPTTQSILAASWAAVAGQPGTYKQTVTLPGALTYAALSMEFRLSTGQVIYPTLERVSATSYDIYINDNTLALTAIYST